MIRRKSFLTSLLLCATPLLLLAALNYWNGLQRVTSTLGSVVQFDLYAFNVAVADELRERESEVLRLAMAENARRLVTAKAETAETNEALSDPQVTPNALPKLSEGFKSVTLFNGDRIAAWFRADDGRWTRPGYSTGPLPQPDSTVWTLQGNVALEKPGGTSATLEYNAPIHDQGGTNNVGAVVGVLDLDTVYLRAARGLESRSGQGTVVIVLDRSGRIVYHSDRSLRMRPANEAIPDFVPIASEMNSNNSGLGQFQTPSGSYLAAYAPIPRLNIAVAVARPRSELVAPAHKWGIAGLVLALIGAVIAAFVVEGYVQRRSRGIARVAADVSAIAKGELDRRIVLKSSDDARGLADNINVVTERLRAQIAREEESRQFESFLRISAMLTHDLKNAIEGLSLTVGNMERHFDNPQFRADALKGLTSAADKLKDLVTRLSRPLTSLSGEHKRPTNIDLIPIIQRVIAMTAEPMRGRHSIVTRLPPNLPALADAASVEEVIENLVLNALEAMSEQGGTLTIEAGQTENGLPTFSISDTGRGISRTFIDTRLFKPFATTKKTGIGLGLYTCREVIVASGGSIEVDSVEGAGTTFRVVLPSIPHDRRN